MVVQQSVGRHDTESSRTADCVERIVSDEIDGFDSAFVAILI